MKRLSLSDIIPFVVKSASVLTPHDLAGPEGEGRKLDHRFNFVSARVPGPRPAPPGRQPEARGASPACIAPILIATPAIRNLHNPSRINNIHFSNRHKTHARREPSFTRFSGQAHADLFSLFAFLFSPFPLLIGPPVIRIRPKSFRISTDSQSNRREMPSFATLEPLTSNLELLIPNRNNSPTGIAVTP